MHMEKLLKIDAHVHSNGISRCSHVTVQQLVDNKRAQGYDGMVLTNHCQGWYYPPEQNAEFIQSFIAEFRAAKAYGDSLGFAVWLGIEATVQQPFYADWLLYGVTEEFLRSAPCLYQLTQEELYALCQKSGVLMVQAHPFRMQRVGERSQMDGVEVNCTPGDLETYEKVIELAKEKKMLVTCGTDYHAENRTFRGGMLVPSSVKDGVAFADYLKTTEFTHIFLEDLRLQIPTFHKK